MQMSHLLSFQISWLLTHKQTDRRLPNINRIIDSSKYIMKIVRCRQRKTIKVRKNWKNSCQFYETLACFHLKCPENTIKIDDIETLNNLKNSTHETTQWKQVIEMPAMTGGGGKKGSISNQPIAIYAKMTSKRKVQPPRSFWPIHVPPPFRQDCCVLFH